MLDPIINSLNDIFWGYVLIYGLLAVGLFFTVRLGFIQFVNFGEMFRSVLGSKKGDSAGITPFQALCTSLASRVGTGNLAGVAVALYLGGPGAIFWMWMVALVGMATAYSESTLAQLYKTRNEDGEYRGGPAFYIAKGLGAPWAGAIFSVCLILAFGLVFNAVQANSIADAMQGAFGFDKLWVGVALAVLTGIVIFGGIKQIARVAEIIVPFMAVIYLLVALYVVIVHIGEIPGLLGTIVQSAFHTFNPYGVSGVVSIAESHLAIHTWPEHGYAAIDVFTCGASVDPRVAVDALAASLKAADTRITTVRRGPDGGTPCASSPSL